MHAEKRSLELLNVSGGHLAFKRNETTTIYWQSGKLSITEEQKAVVERGVKTIQKVNGWNGWPRKP